MFGSRKNDDKAPKRRFWSWKRRVQKEIQAEQVSEQEQANPQSQIESLHLLDSEPAEAEAFVRPGTVDKDESVVIEPRTVESASILPSEVGIKPILQNEVVETQNVQATLSTDVSISSFEKSAPASSENMQALSEALVAEKTAIPEVVTKTEGNKDKIAVPLQTRIESFEIEGVVESEALKKTVFLGVCAEVLSKTRSTFVKGVVELFVGKKRIDDDLLDELETHLLVADVGVDATASIIEKLTQRVKYKDLMMLKL